jgi:plasmid replication initiation protein
VTEEKETKSEILGELESLSQQLVTAVKSLWDSEDSRKLRQEIGDGFSELGRQLDQAVKSAQESEAAKEFRVQVKETMDKAREADVAQKVEQGLVDGLRALNQELSKLVGPSGDKQAEAAKPEDEPEA